MRLRKVPILPVTGPCFHNLVKSNPEKNLTIQEEVKLIVDRLNFLPDLVVGVKTDLMSKSERINLREVLHLVVREPQIWQLVATSSRLQLLHEFACADATGH